MKTLQVPAVIAISTTTSGEVAAPDGYELVGIHAPVCTGTALTLTVASASGGTFVVHANAANSGITHTISATAHYIALDPLLYRGIQFLKLVSGSTELAARTFSLVFQKRAV